MQLFRMNWSCRCRNFLVKYIHTYIHLVCWYYVMMLILYIYICVIYMRIYNRQVTREGEGQASSVFLWRLKKCALILGKNALIVSIYGVDFSFNIKFSEYLGEKSVKFLPFGSIFIYCICKLYSSYKFLFSLRSHYLLNKRFCLKI